MKVEPHLLLFRCKTIQKFNLSPWWYKQLYQLLINLFIFITLNTQKNALKWYTLNRFLSLIIDTPSECRHSNSFINIYTLMQLGYLPPVINPSKFHQSLVSHIILFYLSLITWQFLQFCISWGYFIFLYEKVHNTVFPMQFSSSQHWTLTIINIMKSSLLLVSSYTWVEFNHSDSLRT